MSQRNVVIIGGGFGGVAAAESLAGVQGLEITLIDRRNFHLFQPLLYQVAMAGLNPSEIATPLRSLFRKNKNITVILAEVDKLDLEGKRIHFDDRWLNYDSLILACGSKHAYFGHEEWEEVAPGLKNLEQATEIRRRILTAFELAEREDDSGQRGKYLTFVVVGGGPTGVELAGAIAEMASRTLFKDFKRADLKKTRVILVEAGPRVLAAFPENLSRRAANDLRRLGVEVLTGVRASDLTKDGLKLGDNYVETKTIIWAAGVKPASLTGELPTPKDAQGRAVIEKDLSLPGYKDVFVIGDQAAANLPGIAPVAIQQGVFLKRVFRADQKGEPRPEFKYFDKGIMATIGRSKAVVAMGPLQFSGLIAWLAWVFIHIVYLMRFKNRVFVLSQWIWAYFTFGRGARLITYKTWRFYSGEKIKLD